MPKNSQIKKVLIIGSGPIQIGQGCEFDYSGTQACRSLKEEGVEVVLLNSNPATIMTDPETADKIYIEPITLDVASRIIRDEQPDSILATMGGQKAINLQLELEEAGVLQKYNVAPIGVTSKTINLAEDREEFRQLVADLGYRTPHGQFCTSLRQAQNWVAENNISYPIIIRASFTLGGSGGGIAKDKAEFVELVKHGIEVSPSGEVLVEESILGWKEYELEVMSDANDNFIVICGVENFNPVGVHTGDSITVAPIMTLRDKEYQTLRTISKKLFKKIGMKTGGANIQFAVHPQRNEIVIIEMNPRVSRSSALVSKATGYPIAYISAKLALGYTLDELKNQITKNTTAAFEPMIDYVAVKLPRFDFEKFPEADNSLGIQMKATGEVLAFGQTFGEAFLKACRSLETKQNLWQASTTSLDNIREALTKRSHLLTRDIKRAFELGLAQSDIQKITGISAWYLNELNAIYRQECAIETLELNKENLLELKQAGFSNDTIAKRSSRQPQAISDLLEQFNILPNFQSVDTCAGEFAAETPYFFKTYGTENESQISNKKSVVIIGSGPNRIGQGIEFDYACVHAVKAAQKVGFKAIMINSNPETVSTDFNLANKLYFEPLCAEDVVQILQHEKPLGVFIQFGGQTPLNLAAQIEAAGFKIIGTSLRSSWRAEDRDAFHHLAEELNFNVPKNTRVRSKSAIADFAFNAFPVIVRPSHVIGGAGMCRLETSDEVKNHLHTLAEESFPILVDQFLDNAKEFDMDILSDGKEIYTIGIMEHLEKAGVHSGDSTSFYPPRDLAKTYKNEMTAIAGRIANELEIKGLLNIQFVIKDDRLYVLEINPRCSRTVPFLAKARNLPFIQAATQLALGAKLADLTLQKNEAKGKFFAKVPVFPFAKFKNVNTELGPNMKSIGEVLGSGKTWQAALEMGQKAAK